MSSQIFELSDLQKPLPIVHDVEHSKREETWIDSESHLVGGAVAFDSDTWGQKSLRTNELNSS